MTNMQDSIVEFVENDYVKLWMEEDIVNVFYKKDCIIGLDAAKELVAFRLQFQKYKSCKGMAYITHIGVITPEARKYLSKEGYAGVEKVAIITNSTITTLLGNLFILVNKPIKPTRLFRNKEEGYKWLNSEF